MKPNKIFISFLILFLCAINILFAQWYQQGLNPYDYRLNDIDFVDENHGWIAGENGKLLKTINGGISWEEITIEVAGNYPNLSAISFLDQDSGMVATSEGMILKTIDGGLSWEVLKPADGFDLPYLFYFGELAYAGGYDRIFRMNGNDWEFVDLDTFFEYDLTGFQFINDSTGFFCIQELQGMGSWYGVIFKTTNGFESWETVTHEWFGQFNAYFLNEEEGWTSGHWENDPSGIYRTYNSGNSWTYKFGEIGHKMFFTSMINGWMVNGISIYGFSQNNWSEQFTSEYSYSDIEFVDDQKGWCIGNKIAGGASYESQIFYTETGGYTNVGFQETQFNNEKISISPNPCKDYINIKYIQEKKAELSYSMVSLNGNNQMIEGILQFDKTSINNRINTKELEKGIYILTINFSTKKESYKIIKL